MNWQTVTDISAAIGLIAFVFASIQIMEILFFSKAAPGQGDDTPPQADPGRCQDDPHSLVGYVAPQSRPKDWDRSQELHRYREALCLIASHHSVDQTSRKIASEALEKK